MTLVGSWLFCLEIKQIRFETIHILQMQVGYPIWFAHFGMRSCGGAQLWSCSHLVDHTSIMLISI